MIILWLVFFVLGITSTVITWLLAPALGLNESQLDDLFTLASTL